MARYKIIARLFDGKELVGYRLLDIYNNILYDETLGDIKILAYHRQIDGIKVESSGRLRSTNGVYLNSYPRVRIFKNKLDTLKVGEGLNEYCKQADNLNHRYCYKELMKYLNSSTNKVCSIYGLRRTGKSYMMLQAIREIGYEKCVYISLSKHNNGYDLLNTLKEYSSRGYKYFFIDEITALEDMFDFIATLADGYTAAGIHIVISGTYSYKLAMAVGNELYDRCVFVRTTYISYDEYSYLMGYTDITDYARYGGVLNKSTFYNIESTHRYLTTSISDNIQYSIEKLGRRKLGRFYDLIEMGLFRRCLEAAIMTANESLTSDILIKNFVSKDTGSLANFIYKKRLEYGFTEDDKEQQIKEKLHFDINEEQIRYYLHYANLKDLSSEDRKHLIDEYYDTFLELLKRLDLIKFIRHYSVKKWEDNILFTLPGLRYNQVKEAMLSFFNNKRFSEISVELRNFIMNKLYDDINGQLIEQILDLKLLSIYGYDNVCKFNGKMGVAEIDTVVKIDRQLILIETKLNSNIVEKQYRHLVDTEFMNEVNKVMGYNIAKKIVVYSGEDCKIKIGNEDIYYVNTNSILLNPEKYLSI